MRSSDEDLYFRAIGTKLSLGGLGLAALAIFTTLTLGGFWMMTVMASLPLLGFGLAMRATPGTVRRGSGMEWEKAWTQTRIVIRAIWLAALLVGVALSLFVWMLLMPYVTMARG